MVRDMAEQSGRVLRFCDYDKKSREPDALGPRDPADTAVIIILPMIRKERHDNVPEKDFYR